MYCYVKNGSVERGPVVLPKSWRNISGFNLLPDDRLAELGWLPVVDNRPEHDALRQSISSEMVGGQDSVEVVYTVANLDQADIDANGGAARRRRYNEVYTDDDFKEAYFEKHYEGDATKMDALQASRQQVKADIS